MPQLGRLRPRRWWQWALAAVAAAGVIGGIGGATSNKTIASPASSAAAGGKHAPLAPETPASVPAARTTTTNAPAPQATTQPSSLAPPGAGPARLGGACRGGDPLADVYHPYRLKVHNPCLTVTGTVAYIRREADGDVHVDLSLPASETHLLDRANFTYQNGQLVTEIVPADQPGCTPGQPPPLPPTAYRSSSYDYGTCTGADIATPAVGAEVSVVGPYVLDADHGWMEVHPVWAITVIDAASPSPSAPGLPLRASGSQAAQRQAAPPAAWCQATAAPSNDGFSGDYEVYVHSNQPDAKATASDSGDAWSGSTDGSGYADIRLYHTAPGMTIQVTVGAASCTAT